ncbi:cytochrome c oxidase subunit II [Mangrovicoccus algicola]|uniref:C-type cytochrome n=1 Tax=Mangrovicoccus algicola TaxID=2771008 RepID=A0A8J6YXE4_9RHOB|nr:c-type cytochrome [Mangrovicoccus algicola]MBE3637626.1 c-type cytochrome [Mangrovicoccus algicola]
MRRAAGVLWAMLLSGPAAAARQSVIHPAGEDAALVAGLFWWLLGGAVLLWLLMNGLFLYLTRLNPVPLSRRLAEMLIIGGGVLLPTVVLAVLLGVTLQKIPMHMRPGDGLRVHVTGEEWWWRVEYWPEGADAPIVSANEIRLPAGQRTDVTLGSARVIHSFWIPALGGKLDMFPGRETRMSLLPQIPGTYRGQCAEFCGLSHALMAFEAVVMEPADFQAWLTAQAAPALPPADARAARGRAVFFAEGCGGCHAIRGTAATAGAGPDLTHLGSRTTLASATLPMTEAALAEWIADPESAKPGALMPGYGHLSGAELGDLAHYLKGLR